MSEPYFVDDRHALYAGWVAGIAMRNGIGVEVVADADGNYTGNIWLALPGIRDGVVNRSPTRLLLAVPYPPDDWSFDSE